MCASTRAAAVWSQESRLEAGEADTFDNFGESPSLSGDLLLVGACQDNAAIELALVDRRYRRGASGP